MADKQALTQAYALQARDDFWTYMAFVHETDMEWVTDRQAVPAKHMLPQIERLQQLAGFILRTREDWRDWQGKPELHTSVVAPPGSAKTTILMYFMEWLLGRASIEWDNFATQFHMAFVSSSEDQATRTSVAIMSTITDNPKYQLCFPKVKQDKNHWAKSEWRVAGNAKDRNPTFQAQGRRGSITGSRLNFCGLDDLVKEEEVRLGKIDHEEVAAINTWIRRTIMRRLVPMGLLWGTHTRWLEDDPPGWMKKNGWTEVLVQGLVETAGGDGAANDDSPLSTSSSVVSYWPERFTTESLLAEKEADPEAFELQFMGSPMPETGIDFHAEWLEQTYDQVPWLDAEDRMNYIVVDSWDTAGTTNPRSDFTAGWTAAVDIRTWDKIYLLNLYHDKMEFPEVADALRGSAMSALRPAFIWVEEKSTGQNAIQQLNREGLVIHGVEAYGQRGSPKLDTVIKQVQLEMSRGTVYWPSQRFAQAHGLSWVGEAKRALLIYPRGTHDDIARAFIQLVYETLKVKAQLGPIDAQVEEVSWAEPSGERLLV